MTEIKIRRLVLNNFKCHRYFCLDLMGGNAAIYGDNGTGKTSIYDALTWLLFGKDSQGNGEKNIEIKPLDVTGQVADHDALTEVEAVLDVNGEEVALRRTYKEVWTTKRGSSVATYDGNTSEYFISGVPCKRNAFQDKVNELVSEDTFRMLTSVSHFASQISWQDRRAVLFRVAGVMDDNQILATNEVFAPLVQSMGRLSLEDYKKRLLAEKKQFTVSKSEIPARISECQKTIEDISGMDFAGAKAKVESLQARQESISEQILAMEHNSAAVRKRLDIRQAQLELSQLQAQNQEFRKKQTEGAPDVYNMNIRITALRQQLTRKEQTIQNEKDYTSVLDNKIANSRERWISVNSEVFSGGNCPTCGQVLPEKQLRSAVDRFEAEKRQRLNEIEKTANTYKEAKAQTEARLGDLQREVLDINEEMADLQAQITVAESAKVEPQDMPGFAEQQEAIAKRLRSLNDELADMMMSTTATVEKLRMEKRQIMNQIAANQAIINKESLLDYSRQRIESLRQDAQTAADALEAVEKMLYLMDEYSRYKTQFVEESVNGLFRIARFRLFREQANGGVEDRCDVVYEGVPYISVNNGMKINLGIDIINTLSAAYGVKVPLFVDNAESVTKLEKCGSQVIRLVVSQDDKELRVQYED